MTQRAFPTDLLTQTPATRLAYFKACTIAHPRLQEVDQALQEAISEPTGALLVFFYGPTGVGKTTVLQRCQQQTMEERRAEMERDPGCHFSQKMRLRLRNFKYIQPRPDH